MKDFQHTALLSLLPALASLVVCAKPVDEDTASKAAEGFLRSSGVAARLLGEREVAALTKRGNLWIAHLSPSGHIVVSGSTKCPPIVSFSSGDFSEPEEDSPRKAMLDAAEASAMEREADDSASDHSGWTATSGAKGRKRLLGDALPDESSEVVGPLMTSRWYQTAPLNDFTPLRKVCGCVATAAAQELRFWQWPYRMEDTRISTHNLVNHERQTFRVNGAVPFDYASICDTYNGGMMTANATDHTKKERFALAYLSLWMQSIVKMSYDNGGSGTGVSLRNVASFYERGYGLSTTADNYKEVREGVIADIVDFGSPIQVTVPGHAVVADGFAKDGDNDWIHLNYGWAMNPDDEWYNMGDACTNSNRRIQHFEFSFHPQKIAQLDPLPRICSTSLPVTWHIPPCYTNAMTGFKVDVLTHAAEANQFDDDFSSQKGTTTYDGFSVADGKLVVKRDSNGIYTYPETHLLTESSELAFDVYSWYMVGSTVFVEGKGEGGDWETLKEVTLKWHGQGTEQVSVPLGDFAGRIMQFRLRLEHQYMGYTYGGNSHIDSVKITNTHTMSVNAPQSTTVEASGDEATSYEYEIDGLTEGAAYAISVTPVMSDDSSAETSIAWTRVGEPAGEPSFESISVPYDNIELLQEGFYAECGIGTTNEIIVTCSESTTGLDALPSHLTLLPDDKVSIVTNANVFTVSIDTTEIADEWSGDMIMLTLVASNHDGTQAYKNLMLRFAKPCQIFNGTYDILESGMADKPVELRGTNTTLNAGAYMIEFADGMFRGNGNVKLVADAAAGGGFKFDGLDGFSGTIDVSSGCAVIAGQVPAVAKFKTSSNAQITLAGANVDAKAFSGDGSLVVVSGENTIENIEDCLLQVILQDGTLTINAGETQKVALSGGTLKVRLSDAQVAFGHTMTFNAINDATVEFMDSEGRNISVTQEEGEDGLTFTVPSAEDTKVWVCAPPETNYYNHDGYWIGEKMPQNGDYAIFDVRGGTTTMSFNLPENVALKALYIEGDSLEIVEDGENTLSAEQIYVKAQTIIDTPQIVNSQILTSENITLKQPSCFGCEIMSSIATNFLKTVDGGNAVTNDVWRGTVVYTGVLPKWFNPNSAGNTNSFVRLNGTKGYLANNNPTFTVPVELVDDGETPALDWNDGSSGSTATFKALLGDGTFKTSGYGGNGEKIVINDISGFNGSFDLSAKTVAFGSSIATNTNEGLLEINNGCSATVAPGEIWTINGGVFLDGATAKLDVAGELYTTNITALADNAQLVLSDGGLIAIDDWPQESARINANLYGGTMRFGADATVTDGMCFSSTNDTSTTLDVNGNTLTFAEDAISGHGTIYPTSSSSSPGMVVFRNLGYFAGTIIIDGTTEVQLPGDLSDSGATIDLRSGSMTFSAGSECAIKVAEEATLTLTLTAEQMSAGYNASDVTLEGGAVEFRDLGGNLLKTVRSGGPAVDPVSLEEIKGYVSAFPSLAFKNRYLSELTSDSLRADFGGGDAGEASGQPATFCLVNYDSDEVVMTCEAQAMDGDCVKGVALRFTQYGNDIHVIATATGNRPDGTIGVSVIDDGSLNGDEESSPDYTIYNLRLASVADISETGTFTMDQLFGEVSETSELVIKSQNSATISITRQIVVADVVFDIADDATIALSGETLSAGSITVRGGGNLVVDASGRDVSALEAGERLKILGGANSGGIEALLPDATDAMLYLLDREDDGLYIKAIQNIDWNTININFTSGSTNLTTENQVGLAGVPGTLWNNMPGGVGTTSVVGVVASDVATSCDWPGLSVAVSNTRGWWSCSSLASASDLRHGYIDEKNADGQRTPTVVVSGIPFAPYRVIVYHATDSNNVKFGHDTINGEDLTYVDGVLAAGTTAWGNAGGLNTASAIAEGTNTLVSGIYDSPTLTVVGHRESSQEQSAFRGCIAAIQVVKVETAAIDDEGEFTLEDLFGVVGAASDLVINVNESATLKLASATTVSAIAFNVAEGKTLAITGEKLTATRLVTVNGEGMVTASSTALAGPIAGNGTLLSDMDNSATKPEMQGFDSARWSGTLWIMNGGTNSTGWRFNVFGNTNSILRLSNIAGYISGTETLNPTLDLEGEGLKIKNGNQLTVETVKKLTGSGTLNIGVGSSLGNGFVIQDATGFTGRIVNSTSDRYLVTIGESGSFGTSGKLVIENGYSATIADGMEWSIKSGIETRGALAFAGTGTAAGNVTAYDGATLDYSAAADGPRISCKLAIESGVTILLPDGAALPYLLAASGDGLYDNISCRIGDGETVTGKYKLDNGCLKFVNTAEISETREYGLDALYGGAVTEGGLYFLTVAESATLKIAEPATVEEITFDVPDGKTLTLSGATLSAASIKVTGGGKLSLDASGIGAGLSSGGMVKIVGKVALDDIDVQLPEDSGAMRYALLEMDDGLYLKALHSSFGNMIDINFTHSGSNLTTEANVGLIGVPGTMWDNMPGQNGSLSGVRLFDENTANCDVWQTLEVSVSGSRGSYACGSLAASSTNELRHGYIDENDSNKTPTVTVSGIPFDAYRVIVYHATDSNNVKFGYDTINGKDLTYVDGVMVTGTTAWGDPGSYNTARAIEEGVNTLVSGVCTNPTLTVVGHRENGARGCIAALQIVKVEMAEIDVAGEYALGDIFGFIGTTSDFVIDVNESATLDLGSGKKVGSLELNVAEGKTLTVTWGEGGGATRFAIGGAGRVEFAAAPQNRPMFTTEGDWRWTGTFVMGWPFSGQNKGTAWILDNYGIADSTVEVASDITAGYFKAPGGNNPTVKPAAYFCGNVAINDGYGGNDKATTFASVGMAKGKTFNTRGKNTYYIFEELNGFDGTLNVNSDDHVRIETIVRDAVPAVGEIVANVVTNNALAVIDRVDDVVIAVANQKMRIPAVYDSAEKGFIPLTRTLTVPTFANTTYEVTCNGAAVGGEDGVHTFVYGTEAVVTYTPVEYYRIVENAVQTFTMTNDVEAAEVVEPVVVRNVVEVTVPDIDGAVLTTATSDAGDVARDGNTLSVPAGSTLTLTWEVRGEYVLSTTTTSAFIGADAVTLSGDAVVSPTRAVAKDSIGTYYDNVISGLYWLLSGNLANGYLQLLGDIVGDNIYGAYNIGYDADAKLYKKAIVIIDLEGTDDPGFVTVQSALDAAEDGAVVRLLYDSEETLTLENDKTVTIDARNGSAIRAYVPPVASDDSYTVTTTEVENGVTTCTARDWYEWTVVYANWDGTELQKTTVFEHTPNMPQYTGKFPEKESTPEFEYTFSGWDDEVAKVVTGDITYTAQFTEARRYYTVTWLDDDGTLLHTARLLYGETPSFADPAKNLEPPYQQPFTGWEPEMAVVTSNAQYTATYEAMFADLSTLADDWTAADGDVIINTTEFAVQIPGGASVTINGLRVTGMGSDAPPAATPEFAEGASAEISKFEMDADGNWTITTFTEIANGASGTAVGDGQVRVYRADSPEELKSAEPMTEGMEVLEKKSAVKMKLKVEAPPAAPAQFFKVEFGEQP